MNAGLHAWGVGPFLFKKTVSDKMRLFNCEVTDEIFNYSGDSGSVVFRL